MTDFAASYFGGDNTDYDVVRNTTIGTQLIAGDLTAWNTALSLANAGLTNNAQYEQLQQYVDMDNLIDYMIVNHWAGNDGLAAAQLVCHPQRPAGEGFKFIVWDAEHVLSTYGKRHDRNAAGGPAQFTMRCETTRNSGCALPIICKNIFPSAACSAPTRPIPFPTRRIRNATCRRRFI